MADLKSPTMSDYLKVLRAIQADPIYQAALSWGKPRGGHPEGALANHIAELEDNLEHIRSFLTDTEEARLRVLIHVHDICKPHALTGVPSDHPQNHAFMAREFLARYSQDAELLAITQHHDDGFLLYTYGRYANGLRERLERLLGRVKNPELFLLFWFVDGCTAGKSSHPITWFIDQISQFQELPERIPDVLHHLQSRDSV